MGKTECVCICTRMCMHVRACAWACVSTCACVCVCALTCRCGSSPGKELRVVLGAQLAWWAG